MWQAKANRSSNRPESANVGAAVGAVVAAVATQLFTSRPSELYSEVSSWLLLPILVRAIRRPNPRAKDVDLPFQSGTELSIGACWIIALGLATAMFCAVENGVVGFMPALTPALLAIQAKLQQEAIAPKSGQFERLSLWKASSIAIFGIYSLSGWNILAFAISAIELLGLLSVYTTLLSKPATSSNAVLSADMHVHLRQLAPRVAGTMLVALALQTLFLGFIPFSIVTMLLTSLSKAFTWFFMMELAQNTSWVAATVVKMFSIFATRSPYIQSFETHAILHIIGSGLTLSQLIECIPKHSTNRKLLWALILIPAVPYVTNTFAIRGAHSRVVSLTDAHQHPVDKLVREAKSRFQELTKKQSTSFTAASESYRKRYKMEPPPGFEAWFEYATSHKSRVIDDFDTLYSSIAPFWALSGQQVRQIMNELPQSSNSDVWTCTFTGKSGNTNCVHPWRRFDRHASELFTKSMSDIKGVLPDIKFLVNHLDEPRVLLPKDGSVAKGIKMTHLSQRPTWSKLIQNCKNDQPTFSKNSIDTYDLPFIQDQPHNLNICHHSEYEHMHGLFMSPTSMLLMEGMAPVLSTGAPSTMGDILFPSPAYTEKEFTYSPDHDVDWAVKKNNVYWAGSTTGAFAIESQWKNYHRQRFVGFVQNLEGKQHAYLANTGGGIQRVNSSFLNSRLYDVAFTKVYRSTNKARREQTFFYRMKAWADRDEALRSRLVFDLDGNGISGRWYKLLASKSAPLKQTLLREWHDDRLVPWVHYIPVSQSMDELPELVAYLTSTTQGQHHAKEIAEQGAQWFQQAFRNEDFKIYLYRLLLEMARLQDPARPAHKM